VRVEPPEMFAPSRVCLTHVYRVGQAARLCRPYGSLASACAVPRALAILSACGADAEALVSRRELSMAPGAHVGRSGVEAGNGYPWCEHLVVESVLLWQPCYMRLNTYI
jgi:hypothetical protein